jgi:hypothetical protein
MPNAAAQLMVGPLFRHGLLCLEVGIGGDVLRHIFGPDDFFREQIKTGRAEKEISGKIENLNAETRLAGMNLPERLGSELPLEI